MSAPRSQLELARAVAEQREQRVAAEVQALMRQRDGARETLERLDGYLAEYAGAERRADAGGRRGAGIMNDRGFVGRLHHAAGEQRRQLDRLAERIAQKTRQWNRARADLAAIGRVIERRHGEARDATARREQRELDAAACRPRDVHGDAGAADPATATFTSLRTENEP